MRVKAHQTKFTSTQQLSMERDKESNTNYKYVGHEDLEN